ncbi:hypothetical protein [Sphingomonas sp.]|uniref:hypothetical protein n=1 Tax=Sphingomonas sp. TaxID=28214 RepID=UPI0035C87EC4
MSESADQARTRRRWITLAEFVAVAGLLIGALTLYLNWSDRQEERADRAQATAAEGKAKARVTLVGTVKPGGESISLADPAHVFSAATIRFPAALGIRPVDLMPGPTIQAGSFSNRLLELTDKGTDERQGRLPVLITVTWWDGDARHSDTARYDILWATEGRLLRGRVLRLTGFALADRSASPAALERAWARQKP